MKSIQTVISSRNSVHFVARLSYSSPGRTVRTYEDTLDVEESIAIKTSGFWTPHLLHIFSVHEASTEAAI